MLIINKKLIKNYLTVLYDPMINSKNLAKWKDFVSNTSDINGKITEKFLGDSILNSIHDDDSPISVSLSSGIDSSLCLAILRKTFP